MAGVHIIDRHKDREKIIADIMGGVMSNHQIAQKYGISHGSVNRYIKHRLLQQAAEAAMARDEDEGKRLLDRVEEVMKRMHKLYDACDEYLKDPDNPERYELGPRSWDIDVIYRETNDAGKTVARKAKLQELLERLSAQLDLFDYTVQYRIEDPRRLIVNVARTLTEQLEVIAKIQGAIKDTITNNYTVNQYWLSFKAVIIKATEGYPEILEKITKELEGVSIE
jgi:hypothetical protein